MRFFKKRLLSGLIFAFIFWLLLGLIKLFINILRPVWDFINLFVKTGIPVLNTVLAFILLVVSIFLLGLIARSLSHRAPSKIPIFNKIFKFSKVINDLSHKLETGEIRSVSIQLNNGLYLIGFTTGEPVLEIRGEEMLVVLLPSTPNPTTGYAFFVPKNKIVYLPESFSKSALKIIFTAGLIK